MDQRELNRNLKEVIKQAQDINIPVPADICEQVDINPRPKKRYGCCRLRNGKYYIEVSEFILTCDPDKIREVLAHEVLHTCRGCYDHGNMWKRYAAMMNSAYGYNIKRTSSNAEMGITDTEDGTAEHRDPSGQRNDRESGHGDAGTAENARNSGGAGKPGNAGKSGSAVTAAGRIRYLIKCEKCGREYPRQRCSAVVKNPKKYRCRCGGRLTVFKAADM